MADWRTVPGHEPGVDPGGACHLRGSSGDLYWVHAADLGWEKLQGKLQHICVHLQAAQMLVSDRCLHSKLLEKLQGLHYGQRQVETQRRRESAAAGAASMAGELHQEKGVVRTDRLPPSRCHRGPGALQCSSSLGMANPVDPAMTALFSDAVLGRLHCLASHHVAVALHLDAASPVPTSALVMMFDSAGLLARLELESVPGTDLMHHAQIEGWLKWCLPGLLEQQLAWKLRCEVCWLGEQSEKGWGGS